jgi:hypothetical protein
MNAPTAHCIWQPSAQAWAGAFKAFAMPVSERHCLVVSQRQQRPDLRNYCTTPSLRSGPSQAGPTLRDRRSGADCVSVAKICFEMRDIPVESAAITTNQRGSLPCASRLSFSFFCQRRWPAACRIPHRAGLPVRLLVRSSPMPPRVTFLPVPSSAVLQAPHPAGSSWACRAAADDLTALGRLDLTSRTIRASRPGGPFAFRSALRSGGTACSRKS